MSVLISSAPCGELFTKFLEVQLSPQVSIELPTVVVLDPAGGHSLFTDHLLDEPVVLPHVVKNHEDGGIIYKHIQILWLEGGRSPCAESVHFYSVHINTHKKGEARQKTLNVRKLHYIFSFL